MTTFQKYASAIFSFITVLVGALISAQGHTYDAVTVGQIITLGGGALVMYVVPLLPSGWQGGLKTGVQVVAALVVLALPYIFNGSITFSQILVFIVAAVQVLATQFGVVLRKDDVAKAA